MIQYPVHIIFFYLKIFRTYSIGKIFQNFRLFFLASQKQIIIEGWQHLN